MICKFCGTENVEDAIFCSSCGKRIDGNKVCDACGKTISEQSVFCSYCGARVDGKKICASCGTEVEHAFCQQCGTPYGEEKRVQKTDKKEELAIEKKSGGKYQKVADVLVPTLMICALLALFICSFFIGGGSIEITMRDGCIIYHKSINPKSIFYYVKRHFEVIGDLEVAGLPFRKAIGFYPQAVLMAIMVLANLTCVGVMLTIACVKYIRGFCTGKRVNVTKQAVWSLSAFVVTTVIIAACSNLARNTDDVGIKPWMSDGSVAGLVIGFVLIVASLVLKGLQRRKSWFSCKNVSATVFAFVGAMITVAMIFLVSGSAVKYNQDGVVKMISAGEYMQIAFMGIGDYGTRTFADLTTALWGISIISAFLLFAILAKLFISMVMDKKSTGVILTLSIVLAVFGAGYLALSIITRAHANNSVDARLYNADYATLGGPIAVFVLSMALIAVVSAIRILGKKQKDE